MTPYLHHSDTELVDLLTQGDQNAFSEIYKRYAKRMFSLARKNISMKEDCEEIVQEIFVSLWHRRESLQIMSIEHYLLNAVRYNIIRYFRHSAVKRKYAEHYWFFAEIYDLADESSPGRPLSEVINRVLSELPDRCQYAFRLRLYENLSNPEIAERMNISKRTVEVYMYKAFEHLRASYEKIFKVGS